jgi:protein-tyrosine-phosphatase
MWTTVVAVLLVGGLEAADPAPSAAGKVVFVCEHGSVKSLMAKEWFDRLAALRGIPVRATSRGMVPDASVPAPIAQALARDGFDVSSFRPRRLAAADLEGAVRIVAIGTDTSSVTAAGGTLVERWDAIPPTSEGYEGTRDALKKRIEELLAGLETPRPRP